MNKGLYLPALQGSFGDWFYYVALVRLSDLAERVTYAKELQSNDKLSQLIQRRLDDEDRAKEISDYLLQTQERFFGSLVVGVMGGDPSWHPFGLEAARDDHDLGGVVERDQDLVGYLELRGDESLFALDGQHRLAGIKLALVGDPKLGKEQVSVIFVGHKHDASGIRRTRALFVSINKKAVPVAKRDIIVLDEVDLPAIITRRLLDEHPSFCNGQIDIERFTASLPPTSRAWTTIGNFYDTNRVALQRVIAVEDRAELRAAEKNRLSEERIEYFQTKVVEYYQRLSNLEPALKSLFACRSELEVAEVVRDARFGRESLLFRPIGLKIVTKILGDLRAKNTLSESFKLAVLIPMGLDDPPFGGIIWDPERSRMMTRGESLSTRLLTFMLGLAPADNRLRRAYADYFGIPESDVVLPDRLV